MNKALADLIDFLRIPSVSADSAFKPGIEEAAKWVDNKLRAIGFESEIIPTSVHPLVFATKIVDPQKPTILIYGHYDVQPADPVELWDTPPFEPTVRDGKIYARGATDDKGQLFAHIAAVESLGEDLAVNVKFIIEGEEEVGFGNIVRWIEKNTDRLKVDAVMLSDMSMLAPGRPAIVYALRGLCYLEVNLQGANRDLHSGTYGGGAPNPIQAAAYLISKLKDEKGKIQIPGFWDEVLPITPAEKIEMQELGFDAEEFQSSIGASLMPGEEGFTLLERTTARPTLDINGIWGGYQGEGAKTVIPGKAGFKVSMRLVANQNSHKVFDNTKAFLEAILPEGYSMEVKMLGDGEPVLVETDSDAIRSALRALEQTWGVNAALVRDGASIPVVADFQKHLPGVPIVMMGMGLDDDNLHAPNEKFDLINFEKGIEASRRFLTEMGK